MTKIKLSKDETISSAEFVEKRRVALERYLNRTANHPVLRMDPDFREFLEMDVDLPRAKSTSAVSGAGVLRLFNRLGDSVNKMTFKMDESDPVSIFTDLLYGSFNCLKYFSCEHFTYYCEICKYPYRMRSLCFSPSISSFILLIWDTLFLVLKLVPNLKHNLVVSFCNFYKVFIFLKNILCLQSRLVYLKKISRVQSILEFVLPCFFYVSNRS